MEQIKLNKEEKDILQSHERGEWAGDHVTALREGMPYQTLIASILHKYVTGVLN